MEEGWECVEGGTITVPYFSYRSDAFGPFASPEYLLGQLSFLIQDLRGYNKTYNSPLLGAFESYRSERKLSAASSGDPDRHYQRLFDEVACALGVSTLPGFRVCCLPCRRLCGELAHRLLEAAQASLQRLPDALADVPVALSRPGCIHRYRGYAHPSSSDDSRPPGNCESTPENSRPVPYPAPESRTIGTELLEPPRYAPCESTDWSNTCESCSCEILDHSDCTVAICRLLVSLSFDLATLILPSEIIQRYEIDINLPSCPVLELGRQSGVSGGGEFSKSGKRATRDNPVYGKPNTTRHSPDNYGDSGTAARFFMQFGGEDNLIEPVQEETSVQILRGDCVEEMAKMPENSVDSVVCDPPYGLEFMGKEWDRLGGVGKTSHQGPKERDGSTVFGRQRVAYNGSSNVRCFNCNKWKWGHRDGDNGGGGKGCQCDNPSFPNPKAHQARIMQGWHEAWAREALRVLRPGGFLLAFGGTRTVHRLTCAIEDAGFEIRDTIQWIYGSGFPKSAKVIPNLTPRQKQVRAAHGLIPKAGLETQQRWGGFGSALKPSHEPVVVARRPLSEKSLRAQFFKHFPEEEYGTGMLNIGATRVGGSQQKNNPAPVVRNSASFDTASVAGGPHRSSGARFPSLESALDSLRSVSSALRSYSSSYIDPSPNEGAQDDSQPSDASSDQKHLDRLYPNGVWCGLSVNEALGSQRDCPACRRLCDELFRGIQEAAQESPASLADALEHMCSALSEQGYIHNCQCIDHPSSSGVLGRISALVDLLLGNTTIPYSTHQQPVTSGRWPSNLLLSHVPGPNGCVRVGSRRVKGIGGGDSTPPYASETTWNTSDTPGQKRKGYADPDGLEEVPEYICARDGSGNYLCPIALLDEQSGVSKTGDVKSYKRKNRNGYSGAMPEENTAFHKGDTGGASRFFVNFSPDSNPGFFYCAKSSKRDRTANGTVENGHPTCKPTELMRYLLRLVTPPGGTTLDPFAGSGTTGVAALSEGFNAILIEQSEEYCEIAERRILYHSLPEAERAEIPTPKQVEERKKGEVRTAREWGLTNMHPQDMLLRYNPDERPEEGGTFEPVKEAWEDKRTGPEPGDLTFIEVVEKYASALSKTEEQFKDKLF